MLTNPVKAWVFFLLLRVYLYCIYDIDTHDEVLFAWNDFVSTHLNDPLENKLKHSWPHRDEHLRNMAQSFPFPLKTEVQTPRLSSLCTAVRKRAGRWAKVSITHFCEWMPPIPILEVKNASEWKQNNVFPHRENIMSSCIPNYSVSCDTCEDSSLHSCLLLTISLMWI